MMMGGGVGQGGRGDHHHAHQAQPATSTQSQQPHLSHYQHSPPLPTALIPSSSVHSAATQHHNSSSLPHNPYHHNPLPPSHPINPASGLVTATSTITSTSLLHQQPAAIPSSSATSIFPPGTSGGSTTTILLQQQTPTAPQPLQSLSQQQAPPPLTTTSTSAVVSSSSVMMATQPATTSSTILRFYANWAAGGGGGGGGGGGSGAGEGAAAAGAVLVPRTLTMRVTRLVLAKPLGDLLQQQPQQMMMLGGTSGGGGGGGAGTALVLAVRLQGHRRSLRCPDIINPSAVLQPSSSANPAAVNTPRSTATLDTPLDISFTIHYSHFLKRKTNVLQLLLQRRKKYKNRQIPGFKTLALGHLNLDEVLQFGGQSREVTMWDTASISSLHARKGAAVGSAGQLVAGTLHLAQCYSHPTATAEARSNSSDRQQSKRAAKAKFSRVMMGRGGRRPVLTGSAANGATAAGASGGGASGCTREEEESSDSGGGDSEDAAGGTHGCSSGSRNRLILRNKKPSANTEATAAGQQRKKQSGSQRVIVTRQNIKKKVVALLRRFRDVPDDDEEEEDENEYAAGEVLSTRTSHSHILPPTEKELEEMLEELENISTMGGAGDDYSGNWELEPDKVSIASQPRPRLRPFFGSRLEIPPLEEEAMAAAAVAETEPSIDSENSDEDELEVADDGDDYAVVEELVSSSGMEEGPMELAQGQPYQSGRTSSFPSTATAANQPPLFSTPPSSPAVRQSSTLDSLNSVTGFLPIHQQPQLPETPKRRPTSSSGGGTSRFPVPTATPSTRERVSGAEVWNRLLASLEAVEGWDPLLPSNLCVCSSADLPWLMGITGEGVDGGEKASSGEGSSAIIPQMILLDCVNQQEVKAVMQGIVGRIQKFCNSNSISPSSTVITLLGGDTLFAHLLRAYVDLMQQKTSTQEWLHYLRFHPLFPPTGSVIGRLLTQLGGSSSSFTQLDGCPTAHPEEAWPTTLDCSSNDESPDQQQYRAANLEGFLGRIAQLRQPRAMNLPIGEAMLQLTTTSNTRSGNGGNSPSQLFIPFVAEVNLITTGLLPEEQSNYSQQQPQQQPHRPMLMRGATSSSVEENSLFSTSTKETTKTKTSMDGGGKSGGSRVGSGPGGRPGQVTSSQSQQSFSIPVMSTAAATPGCYAGQQSSTSPSPRTTAASAGATTTPTSSRTSIHATTTPPIGNGGGGGVSGVDLQFEYWVQPDSHGGDIPSISSSHSTHHHHSPATTISSASSSGSRFSTKACVWSLSIGREPPSTGSGGLLYCMWVVKEKPRRDNVLQRLGRRPKTNTQPALLATALSAKAVGQQQQQALSSPVLLHGAGASPQQTSSSVTMFSPGNLSSSPTSTTISCTSPAPPTSAGFQSRVVASVSRVVCSGREVHGHGHHHNAAGNKHGGAGSSGGGGGSGSASSSTPNSLDLLVDGMMWRGVKFFQVSAQWPTHVKLFPIVYSSTPT